jgi:branched-chain amino acid transport system permease protein
MSTIENRLPARKRRSAIGPYAYVYGGLVVLLAFSPLFITSSYWLHILIITFIYIIATVSLRTIVISGQFPLAHAAFMGIGAYASAVVAKDVGWSPWLTIPMGALLAMGFGILIGYPFALFHTISRIPYYYFFLGLTSLSLFVLHRFEYCRIGTTLKAIEQSYLVAASVGINEARYRVLALAVGCFFAGLAGATYAHYNSTLSYTSFDMLATLWLFLYMLIGGMGTFAGPIVGVLIFMIVPEIFRDLKQFVPYISAAILFIVAFAMPQGLIGLPKLIWSLLKRTWKGDVVTDATGN